MKGEETDAVFQDVAGLWVRDPRGNCRPFDIHDYESLTARIAELEGALGDAREQITNWFSPWGAWKTAWWEDFASDDTAYTAENFIKALRRQIARSALPDQDPTP